MARFFAIASRIICIAAIPCRGFLAADCDRDGREDREQIAEGAEDCNGNGVLDTCDLRDPGYRMAPSELSVYRGPGEAAAADLDDDGSPDIAVATDTRLVTVIWNLGVLQPAGYVAHEGSRTIAIGDLDGDGDSDILAPGHSVLSVVRNHGGRSMAPDLDPEFFFPVRPEAMALADIDGDGDPDAAAAGGSDIHLLRNDGSGGFSLAKHTLADGGPIAIFPVDLDRNGKVDFVTGNRLGSFAVWTDLASGAGAPVFHETGRTNAGFAMGDLDGSGSPEIISVNYDGTLQVNRHLGNGVFSADSYSLEGEPTAVRPADLDGDGDLDLAVTDARRPLRVFENGGDGRFHLPIDTRAAPGATSLLIHDITGDGTLDIIAPERGRDAVHFLEGTIGTDSLDCNGNGVPDECDVRIADCDANGIPDSCDALSIGDCDGNGVPDSCDTDCDGNGVTDACEIASASKPDCNGNGVPDACDIVPSNVGFSREHTDNVVFSSMATGSFFQPGRSSLVTGWGPNLTFLDHASLNEVPRHVVSAHLRVGDDDDPESITAVAAGDVDGDGRVDAAFTTEKGFFVTAQGVGFHRFELDRSVPLPGGVAAGALALADLDADGAPDAVAGFPGGIIPMENQGGGLFVPQMPIARSRAPRSLWTGDLGGDGFPEVASAGADGDLAVFPNRGGLLGVPGPRGFQGFAGSLAGGDADNDGDLDLIAGRSDAARVTVIENEGNDLFSEGFALELPSIATLVDAADLDGDGDLDLACTFDGAAPPGTGVERLGRLKVLLGKGDGTFEDAVTYGIAPEMKAITFAIGDADGNGSPDLIVGAGIDCEDCVENTEIIVHLRNLSAPAWSGDADGNGIPDDCQQGSFRRGDILADGRLDLSDPLSLLGHLFRGEAAPRCLEAADADDDGAVMITDAIYILGHLFLGGAPPPEPGPPPAVCGFDRPRSPSSLGCGAYEGCF